MVGRRAELPQAAEAANTGPTLHERAEVIVDGARIREEKSPCPGDNKFRLHETETKRIERELRNEERGRLQGDLDTAWTKNFTLYDQAPIGYLALSAEGLIVEANHTAAILLGMPDGDLVNRYLSRFIIRADRHHYYRYFSRILTSSKQQNCELRMQRADHTVFWSRLEASKAQPGAGGASRYRVTLSDLPEQRRLQERMRENEERMQEALRVGRSFTFEFEPSTDRIQRSSSATFLLGLNDREAIEDTGGVFFSRRVHPDDRDGLLERMHTLTPDHDRYETRYRIVRSDDGAIVVLDECARGVFDAQGVLIRLIGVSTDVTARERAEEDLKEASQSKDEFLAMLAHELRNPLAPMWNAMEILKRPNLSEADCLWCHGVLVRQLQHLTRLVDDLLDVSRISRGKIELRKEPLDLADVVERAVEISQPKIEARKQELQVQLPPEPVRVEGDRVRLAQVVANLLNNAAKYTEEHGNIALIVEPADHTVLIRVRDNGRGIDPEALPKVFDLFYQTDRGIDRAGGGLGIGLSLAKKLVELHGGQIHAFSEGRGQGSEFVIQLTVLDQG